MIQAVKAPLQPKSVQAGVETKSVLNCYEILNVREDRAEDAARADDETQAA